MCKNSVATELIAKSAIYFKDVHKYKKIIDVM